MLDITRNCGKSLWPITNCYRWFDIHCLHKLGNGKLIAGEYGAVKKLKVVRSLLQFGEYVECRCGEVEFKRSLEELVRGR
jgi:hypothetical protein